MLEPGFVRLKDNRIGKIKKYNDKWFPLGKGFFIHCILQHKYNYNINTSVM